MTTSRGIRAPYWRWTPSQVEALRALYPLHTAEQVAKAIGCTDKQVYRKAQDLGLTKDPAFYAKPESGRDNLARGSTSRFAPGQEPWNKGKKLPGHGNPATFFPPGHRPHSYRPVGSLRLSPDGYLQIKATATGYAPKDWVGVHRFVWEQAHGPVPAGHVVVFKPGTRTTERDRITLDNLECISMAENMRRNTVHRYGPELAQLAQLRGVLNRQINKRAKEQQA